MGVEDVLGRTAGPSCLSASLPEHLVLVVYASSRWRPILIVYESSAALFVRFAFVFLPELAKRCNVIMLTCDRMNFDVYSFILLLRDATT